MAAFFVPPCLCVFVFNKRLAPTTGVCLHHRHEAIVGVRVIRIELCGRAPALAFARLHSPSPRSAFDASRSFAFGRCAAGNKSVWRCECAAEGTRWRALL